MRGLVCLLGLLTCGVVLAEVRPETRAFLDDGPTSVKALWSRLTTEYRSGSHEDCIALGERILSLGKEYPQVLLVLARSHHALGHEARAIGLLERLLELEPASDKARRFLESIRSGDGGAAEDEGDTEGGSGGGTTLVERLFGTVSEVALEALRAYHADDVSQAQTLAETALSRDPGDPGALFAQALVQRSLGLGTPSAYRAPLEYLSGLDPRAEFLAHLEVSPSQPQRERFLDGLSDGADAEPGALVLGALEAFRDFRGEEARRMLEQASRDLESLDRSTLLLLLQAYTQVNDNEGARKVIEVYESVHGEDCELQIRKGVYFRNIGQFGNARKAVSEAYRKDPYRLRNLAEATSLLGVIGEDEEAVHLVALARQTYPEVANIESLAMKSLGAILTDRQMRHLQDGIWYVEIHPAVEEKAFNRAMSTLKESYRHVGAWLNHFPKRVRVKMYEVLPGGGGTLAFYSPTDDKLHVAAREYVSDDMIGRLTAQVVSRHEYTHYAHASLQRELGLEQRVFIAKKWLSEGLAEWTSDGLAWRVAAGRDHVAGFLRRGPFAIPEIAAGAFEASTPNVVNRWYLQGYYMVSALVGEGENRKERIREVVRLSMDLLSEKDLARAVKERFGMTMTQWEQDYRDRMKEDLKKIQDPEWRAGRFPDTWKFLEDLSEGGREGQ